MKRLLAFFVLFSMMLGLVACGGGSSGGQNSNGGAGGLVKFEEIEVVDNDEVTIVITEQYDDKNYGYTLKVALENKSSDTDYQFAIDHASINGVENDPWFYETVNAGKKANSEINFSDIGDLNLTKLIGDFTDVELNFIVRDYNDYSADPIFQDTVHVYPYGKDKATLFVRQAEASDKVVIDDDDVTIIIIGHNPDAYFGYEMIVYMMNKTDKKLSFGTADVSIDGYMMNPAFSSRLEANRSKFDYVLWNKEDFETNGITDVNEIEMKFRVIDYETWEEIKVAPIVINP